jgi:putative ABC transport system permease protein
VTVAQAGAEMKSVSARLAEQFPAANAGWSSHVMVAPDALWGPQGKMAFALLLGVVFAVLLIACANVAGLQFARGAARRREMAVRQALGAGRWRLIRQLLTENLLLALLGGSLGMLLAAWGLSLIEARYGASLELLNTAVIDRRVLAYTMALALLSALFCGLTPALQKTACARRPNARMGRSLRVIITQLNPILRGWYEYFKHSHPTTW